MWADFAPDGVRAGIFLLDMENGSVEYVIVAVENGQYSTVREGTVPMSRDGIGYLEENVGKWWQEYKKKNSETKGADEGYGTHPSQRVDPRTGKRYVPPKSPLGQGVAEGEADYGADYQDKVKRLGQMARQGERKTVWDPVKRVYKTVPVNAPKKDEPTKETKDSGSYAANKPGYSGEANYTAQPNWRGMNIGEDVDDAMARAIARLIESQLK
jgi:hypothetical protein